MTRLPACAAGAIALAFLCVAEARAQDPPPKIGPFVIDLHGTVPRFPRNEQLAQSRGVQTRDLPTVGLGLHAGAHVYPLKLSAITFGLGGDLTIARAHQKARQFSTDDFSRDVVETFTHIAPELSLNFGTGNGWSYLSVGMSPSVWSISSNSVPSGSANTERLTTINYGGGARWFNTAHLAFSFDVRFYAVYPGTPELGRAGGPRTRLVFMGAGISIK